MLRRPVVPFVAMGVGLVATRLWDPHTAWVLVFLEDVPGVGTSPTRLWWATLAVVGAGAAVAEGWTRWRRGVSA